MRFPENLVPLLMRPIVVRECNAESGVSDEVHEAKSRPRKQAGSDVILNDHASTNATCLFHESRRPGCMMEDVDKHYYVEALVREGDRFTIKAHNPD